MPATQSSYDRLQQLRAELERVQESALQELVDRRSAIVRELDSVNHEIAKLTGKTSEGRTPKASTGRKVSLQQLKQDLEAAPGKTLNIRKANLELRNIKDLVEANPQLLKIGGVGAWPTVALVGSGSAKSKLYPLEPELG